MTLPDTELPNIPATATEFKAIRTEALTKLKQTFTITEASGTVTLTSAKGVKINDQQRLSQKKWSCSNWSYQHRICRII